MPRNLVYFLIFSNFCVLALYGLRWWSNFQAVAQELSSMQESHFGLLWSTMPKAIPFFVIALIYLLVELINTIKTTTPSDILDIPNPSSNSDL